MYVVVIVDQSAVHGARIEVHGPYASTEQAEQARRRSHLDIMLAGPLDRTKTYVREVGPA